MSRRNLLIFLCALLVLDLASVAMAGKTLGPTKVTIYSDDAYPVRQVGYPPTLDMARGGIAGTSVISKFGHNPEVGATAEGIWHTGGAFNFLSAASAVRIKAGGNAADTSDGAGARSVTVLGLDENWEDASETITTAGASASSATTTTSVRVFRAYVSGTGTYGGANTDTIVIETTGGTTLASIEAGKGQTEIACYTVPAGKTGYLVRAAFHIESTKGAQLELIRREGADVVSAPYSSPRLVFQTDNTTLDVERTFDAPVVLPAKTDVWCQATRAGANDVGVACRFDVWLVDN